MTCSRCGSSRLTAGYCLDCWWTPHDWGQGRVQPVTDRMEYQRSDGTIWRWRQADGLWCQQEVPR